MEVFVRAAKEHPQATALVHEGKQVTYQQLLQDVLCTAAYYQEKGIAPGSNILVFIPMSIELYRTVLALMYIGAVPVFLDGWVAGERLRECLDVVPCEALIAPVKLILYSAFSGPLRSVHLKIKAGKRSSAPLSAPPYATDAANTALITFTTGSTGIPKAADRTHTFLQAQLTTLMPLLPANGERTLTTLPIVVLMQLAMGRTTYLPPEKFKIDKPDTITHIATECKDHKINTLIVSPAVIDGLTKFTLPQIRHILTGGGPVFPSLAGDITIKFPQAVATIIYGSTEAEPISHISSAEVGNTSLKTLQQWGLPVGVPDAAAMVSIIPFTGTAIPQLSSFNWRQMQCQPGEAGEIVVTGEHVLKHYINNPEAVAMNKIHVDGMIWHRTGDAGRISADGRLYFLGRAKEAFDWNNKTVFPVIAANCFKMRSRAREAAVLMHKGQPTLVIEADTALPERMLTPSLEDAGLAGATIRYLKKIPKDPRHQTKIDYDKLAAHL